MPLTSLVDFPTDVLSKVAYWLHERELINLLACGSWRLFNNLTHGSVVKRIAFDVLSLCFPLAFPSVIFRFRQLESFSYRQITWSRLIVPADLIWNLPPTLRRLSIIGRRAEDLFCVPPTPNFTLPSILPTMATMFPDLKHLEVCGEAMLNGPDGTGFGLFEALPKSLTHLCITNKLYILHRFDDIPTDVSVLKLRGPCMLGPKPFPQWMTKLELWIGGGALNPPQQLLPRLPPHLASLRLQMAESFTYKYITMLPRSLTKLELRNDKLGNKSVALLPGTLTHLYLTRSHLIKPDCFPNLPPNLRYLRLGGSMDWVNTSEYDAFIHFGSLPPSLTTLWLDEARLSDTSDNRVYLQNVQMSFMAGLPRSLSTLHIPKLFANQKWCFNLMNLPPSLTHLCIDSSHFNTKKSPECFSLLQDLQHLDVVEEWTAFHEETIDNLPKGLKSFCMIPNRNTFKSHWLDKCPPALETLRVGNTLLAQWNAKLPNTVSTLSVNNHNVSDSDMVSTTVLWGPNWEDRLPPKVVSKIRAQSKQRI